VQLVVRLSSSRRGDEFPDRAELQRAAAAQRPGEGPATFREVEAGKDGMQVRTPARQPVTRVGDDGPFAVDLGRDHSQQDGPICTPATTHTGA
jgi:hypothetical protein